MPARGPHGTEPRLRRRQIASTSVGAERAARNGPDVTHLIGLGILLSAALLIAIGSFSAPARSTARSAATEGSIAAAETQGRTR